MIQQNIIAYLTGELDFIDDVFWMEQTKGETSLPHIVFKQISDPALYQSNDKWQRWRFYITGTTPLSVQELEMDLYDKLNGLSGDMEGKTLDFVQKIGDDSSIEKREDGYYQMYVDYRFIYH